ncbi:MAG: sulfatase-like hydrolase/transferase [Candidatus Poribacteria bacterium]|jgi:N-acetylgalactosamine-6-sulfatase|nr:sulfatase-like hydrolase/transferase [Candidatus Poribacteria bacterium]MDP6745452.1 sulfatase-like hydrolase/transferase [Candidatus Poribacteria bacterium]MDP6995277.1 sulfatase-like hydrolase/transferase [Candidatus Poribacteria bacterium]
MLYVQQILRKKHSMMKPNILFIFADDWGWGDLSCHGHPYVKTPNIDRLANEGTDIHRFTVASGVCSPSRTAAMTGHFPARYNIDGHFAWASNNASRGMPDWLSPEAPFLPQMLRNAGYRTAHFGKWHLSNNMIPDSPLPEVYGYDHAWAFNCAGEQLPVHEDARKTIEFIEKAHRDGKPFYVNLWVHEPHTPFHTVPRYERRFRHIEDEKDRIYASVLSHADDRIGEVLATLDRLEITKNTLVIFSSDNGPARAVGPPKLELMYDTATGAGWGIAASRGITGGCRGYKAALFEGGIGVPFIARWPGRIAAGQVDQASLISAVDLLPTFCEIAGVEISENYAPDGMSMVSVLMGDPMPSRMKPLFWKAQSAWPAPEDRPDHWVSWAIVQETWKLVANGNLDHVELYRIDADLSESTNVAESQSGTVQILLGMTKDWQNTLPEEPDGDVFSTERALV